VETLNNFLKITKIVIFVTSFVFVASIIILLSLIMKTYMKNVTIYSTPTCHFCRGAKEFFKKNNIPFTDYNVAEDNAKRTEMLEKSGQMGVPVIFVENEMIIGFNEPRLKNLLGIA